MSVPVASAEQRTGFPWRWLVGGIIAYLVFLLATAPAVRLSPYLQRQGLLLSGVEGTLWKGSASAAQIDNVVLGPTTWTLSPWRLLIGQVRADLHMKRDDGYLDAIVTTGFGDSVRIADARASIPITALNSLPIPGGVNGWNGTLQTDIKELVLSKGWPTQFTGTIDVANLIGPPQQPTPLGSFRITFPAPTPAVSGQLNATVVSLDSDGPLDLAGTFSLGANRTYEIKAEIKTKPTTPGSIVRALQYLGPPDAQGRRPFSLAGSL